MSLLNPQTAWHIASPGASVDFASLRKHFQFGDSFICQQKVTAVSVFISKGIFIPRCETCVKELQRIAVFEQKLPLALDHAQKLIYRDLANNDLHLKRVMIVIYNERVFGRIVPLPFDKNYTNTDLVYQLSETQLSVYVRGNLRLGLPLPITFSRVETPSENSAKEVTQQ